MNGIAILDSAPAQLRPLLHALGTRVTALPFEHLAEGSGAGSHAGLVLSSDELVRVVRLAASRNIPPRALLSAFRRVLVFGFAAAPDAQCAFEALTGVRLERSRDSGHDVECRVTGDRSLCGPFAGLSFRCVHAAPQLIATSGTTLCEWAASGPQGGLFGRVTLPGLDVFVAAGETLFDVAAGHSKNLQVSACFDKLVPLIWFLRQCEGLPRVTGPWANWILDDPNLTRRHGFVRLDEVVAGTQRMGAAITIGFIPWNFWRASKRTIDQFRAAWPQASICVHGCNHTRSEFSTATVAEAYQLGTLAMTRMGRMESNTTLHFDRVMVFPQGKFSGAAMTALRSLGLIGVVNTELMDSYTGRGVTGGDLLEPALTCLAGLPMFLRRPADDPIANFALDLLLGKPCLVVTHHDYFRAGMQPMMERIDSLNRLAPDMHWTSLEHGITSMAAFRQAADGTLEARLYSPRTLLNLTTLPQELVCVKREPECGASIAVRVERREVPYERHADQIRFVVPSAVSPITEIDVRPVTRPSVSAPHFRMTSAAQIAARRYLSEFRDNYIDRFCTLKTGIATFRKLTRGGA